MKSTSIILAGGRSSRMGQNKALLKIGSKTVIERIMNEVNTITNQVIIVTNTYKEYTFLNLPMVEDEWKGKGPLAGIHAGLLKSETDHNLVIACDMPFVSAHLGQLLLENLEKGFQAVVPKIDGQLHPLFAAYHKNVCSVIEESIKNEQLKIRSILNKVPVKIIDELELQKANFNWKDTDFFNMNHPEDFQLALSFESKEEQK